MARTTLSTKGQVIIPREIRDRHGWTPGTRLDVEDRDDGILVRAVSSRPVTTVDDLLGILPWKGKAKSLAEMEAGIARGARRRG